MTFYNPPPSRANRVAARMFDPPAPGSAEERRQLAAARMSTAAYSAVGTVSLLLEDPEHIADRPWWSGAQTTERRARPLTRLQTAVWLQGEARNLMRACICAARAEGESWAEIGGVLDLADGSPSDKAVAAYEAAVQLVLGERFLFDCASCGAAIVDNGPYEPHPVDRETGHTETCERQCAAIAEWERNNQ